MNQYTIGEVVKSVGVSHDTLRLYERYGLIDHPPRSANGYRQYSDEAVMRIKFILRAKHMGFTLCEIGELLAIRQDSEKTCHDVREESEKKLLQIKGKISGLKKMERALTTLIQMCHQGDAKCPCPILTALEAQESKHHGNENKV